MFWERCSFRLFKVDRTFNRVLVILTQVPHARATAE